MLLHFKYFAKEFSELFNLCMLKINEWKVSLVRTPKVLRFITDYELVYVGNVLISNKGDYAVRYKFIFLCL